MKKLILLIFTLVAALLAFGQNRSMVGGGGGHFMAGVMYDFTNSIDDYLRKPSVIGMGYEPAQLGLQVGGEGYGMFWRFSIGGGGFGFSNLNSAGLDGKVERSGGAGYLKVGYCMYERKTMFAMAHVGIGGYGYSLKIKNTSADKFIRFNQLAPVEPGERKNYRYSGTMLDLTISLKNILTLDMNENQLRGVIVGLDAGCMLGVPNSSWRNDEEILGPPEPGLTFAPYVRLTVGGGGLKF